MSNTLTSLAQPAFAALQTARRQNHGLIQAVTTDFDARPVPKDEVIKMPINSVGANADATPAATSSSGSDTTVSTRDLTLTKRRKNSFHVTGDDAVTIERIGFAPWFQNRLAKSMIAILDEVEADLAALYIAATYAVGTAGTTPFASDHKSIATLRRFAEEAGAVDDLQLVINPLAGENLRGLSTLTKANEAGTDATLREGTLLDINGFKVRMSSQIKTHTPGTGAGYLTNGGEALGATALTVDTGTGTVVAGDLISITGDALAKYIASGAIAANELPLNAGLKKAVADNIAIATMASYAANMAFARRAIGLAIRPTALPPGGDGATEAMIVADKPVSDGGSGLAFQVLRYGQYLQASYEVHATWGVAAFEPEAIWGLVG